MDLVIKVLPKSRLKMFPTALNSWDILSTTLGKRLRATDPDLRGNVQLWLKDDVAQSSIRSFWRSFWWMEKWLEKRIVLYLWIWKPFQVLYQSHFGLCCSWMALLQLRLLALWNNVLFVQEIINFLKNSKSNRNLQSSMPSPPLPHSLLNNRIPETIWVSSCSCFSLSRLLRDMNVPSSVWGNTLCSAAEVRRIVGSLGRSIKKQEYSHSHRNYYTGI